MYILWNILWRQGVKRWSVFQFALYKHVEAFVWPELPDGLIYAKGNRRVYIVHMEIQKMTLRSISEALSNMGTFCLSWIFIIVSVIVFVVLLLFFL